MKLVRLQGKRNIYLTSEGVFFIYTVFNCIKIKIIKLLYQCTWIGMLCTCINMRERQRIFVLSIYWHDLFKYLLYLLDSHLMGLFYRTIRMVENGIKPVYVFDGKPPTLKGGEVKTVISGILLESWSTASLSSQHNTESF